MEVLWTLVKRHLIPPQLAALALQQAMEPGHSPSGEREGDAVRLVERILQESSVEGQTEPSETAEALARVQRTMRWRRRRITTFSELAGHADGPGMSPEIEIPDRSTDPARIVERREMVRQIMQAAHHLSPDQKAAFVLAHVLDLPLEDVRASLPEQKGSNAISCLLHRARGNIRSQLQRRGYDGGV